MQNAVINDTRDSWIHFKNQYCSATDWNIDKLNQQAIKYNNKFGVSAFVFSLGLLNHQKDYN